MGSMTEQAPSYLVDTNVLLRLASPTARNTKAFSTVRKFCGRKVRTCSTPLRIPNFGMFARDLQFGMDLGFQFPKQTSLRA